MTTVNKTVRVAAEAQALVNKALSRVSTGDRARVEQALSAVAGQNRDRYLNRAEAQVVVDAFESVAAGSGLLGGEQLQQALTLVEARAKALSQASNVDGVSAHFTFQGSLEQKLIAELHDAVAAAKGRRLDVNMMIFEFQSDGIEQAIADVARANPNVTFRIVADAGQASSGGGNALPSLLELKLPNVQVKYKKDFPYVWDSNRKAPVYNHGASKGLNHHKGFATLVDGVPDRLVTGSFNWSNTADTKNYEDMVVMKAVDAATRRAVSQYHDEFAGFFNGEGNALPPNAFHNFKRTAWNELVVQNGGRPTPFVPRPADDYPRYEPGAPSAQAFDLNGFRPEDKARLSSLVGSRLAGSIWSERARYGRFDSFEELAARVPAVASLPAEKRQALQAHAQLGSGAVSI
ncbi:MAG: phospholipase D-like domain-containing protein, partial [Myxococcales bacterium]